MSGFVRVYGSFRVGSVVARPLASGWVWASRPLPAGGLLAGFSPAPICLFIPFSSRGFAVKFAQLVGCVGWRSWVRPGVSGSQVFSACSLSVPAFAVKVALPSGWSACSGCVVLSSLLLSASL
jgi:hypothetical protein